MDTMTTAAVPTPTPAPGTTLLGGRIDLTERRTQLGLGIMAFCLGVMVGARLMRGAVPPGGGVAEVPGPVAYRQGPCAECAERAIQAARAAGQPTPTPTPPPAPSEPQPAATAPLIDPEAAEREAMAQRQQEPTNGAPKHFSAYNEATLPAELVTNGDSSLGVEVE